jgi:hypothetical protein
MSEVTNGQMAVGAEDGVAVYLSAHCALCGGRLLSVRNGVPSVRAIRHSRYHC